MGNSVSLKKDVLHSLYNEYKSIYGSQVIYRNGKLFIPLHDQAILGALITNDLNSYKVTYCEYHEHGDFFYRSNIFLPNVYSCKTSDEIKHTIEKMKNPRPQNFV